MASSYGLFSKPPGPKKAKNDVFYVRWGGIPSWDPRTETLKKANTWGMGSGGLCLTSLHENKIREIAWVTIEKHNKAVISNLIHDWISNKLKTNSDEFKELIEIIAQYQTQTLLLSAKGLQPHEFIPPTTWPKELIELAQHVLTAIPILIENNNLLIHPKDMPTLIDEISRYEVNHQRENKDEKTLAWPPLQWSAPMRQVGLEAHDAVDHMISTMESSGIIPLFYTEKEHQQFYFEYCNKRLWPLFHRHFSKSDQKSESKDIFEVAPCNPEAFKEYQHLSEETAKAITENAPFGGSVWLHDYHLFLIPDYLKELRPDLKLGYHFHIPVPDGSLIDPLDDDIEKLFTSVMRCTYLSFNTQKDMENFKAIVGKMGLNTKNVTFACNPIGAEPIKTLEQNPQPKTQKTIEEIINLRKKHQDFKTTPHSLQVILSVDRIEPSKGLKTRLKAIHDILKNPESLSNAENLLFVMVCPDSRSGIKAYDELNKWFKEEVQRLNVIANKKIGRDIIKLHGEMPQAELQTLGKHADTFMATSDADGLHLGPAEWIATQNYHDKEKKLNVILSMGAGISEYLPNAMRFEPGDHQKLGDLICQTTTESTADKADRSNKIKNDFHKGPAKGFSLETWHEKAASGLAKKSLTKGQDPVFTQKDKTKDTGGKGHYGSMGTTPRRNS